jgi:hypothetical protein
MGEKSTLTYKFRLRDKHSAELNRQARAVNFGAVAPIPGLSAANALGKATRREAEKTADAMQERLERIDWALASDTAAIEVLQ